MIEKLFTKLNQKTWIVILLILLLAFVIRIWQIDKVSEFIFDEVYFVKFAQNYLSGASFFDIHPPLGKLIIALGIIIFGDNPFGWRIMPAIFGTLTILAVYLSGKELGGKIMGFFAASILFFDGMILVYSRTGLIDIFLICFLSFAFAFFLRFTNTHKLTSLALAGLFLGLASSVKYIGALMFLVFIVVMIVKKVSFWKNIKSYIIFLIVLPLVIYIGFFLFNFHGKDFLYQVFQWHWQSFNYNINLTDGHPYASKWWGWFLLIRPIWLYYKDNSGSLVGIDGIGNPLIWWSSVVVVPLLFLDAIRHKKSPLIILAGFLIFWLFWAFFKRVLFLYHALASFIFLSLGISWYLKEFWQLPKTRIWVAIYLLAILLFFIFLFPIWGGLPIDSSAFYHRIWFKNWI